MSKKSSSTTKPWKPAQPYILGGAETLKNTYNATAPKIQEATNSVTGLLPGMIEKYQAGDKGINAARDYNAEVLSGRYLGGNPYLDEMLARSGSDVRNQMQAALGVRGLTGGSDYAGIIADRVAKNSLSTRYQDYDAERSRMATAAGQAPGIAAGDVIQVQPMLATLGATTLPLDAAGDYAAGLGGLLGQYQKTTQKQGLGVTLGNIAGNAAAAFAMSDARLKEDIRRVGQTDAGLPVYTYRYKGSPQVLMGVMAQDVAREQPEALGPTVGGYASVYYGEVR